MTACITIYTSSFYKVVLYNDALAMEKNIHQN